MNSSEKIICSEKNLKVKLRFLGASSGIVTGSASLLTITRGNDEKNILIDCGMYQGDDEFKNFEREFDTQKIDAIIITHSHLDHCGMLPALFKETAGKLPYKGYIYGSRETLNQAVHILIDAAIINERKAKLSRGEIEKFTQMLEKEATKTSQELDKLKNEMVIGSSKKIPDTMVEIEEISDAITSLEEELDKIPYTVEDVNTCITCFKHVDVDQNIDKIKPIVLFDGISFKLIPNSHINGATMVEIYISYGKQKFSIAFSGDVGKQNSVLYRKFAYPEEPRIDVLVLESLHGTKKEEESLIESTKKLEKIIKKAVKEHRPCIIPVFALDRMAIFIKVLNDLVKKGVLKFCFVDTPLGERELQEYISSYNTKTSAWFDYSKEYPFNLGSFKFVRNYRDHVSLVKFSDAPIVLTSSCMGNGGRVIDYFNEHLQDDKTIFVFPGYLVDGTPSRRIVEAKHGEFISINDCNYIKRCETYWLHGFSSHGYFEDKLAILERYINVKKVFVNHADKEDLETTQKRLSLYLDSDVEIAELDKEYQLL